MKKIIAVLCAVFIFTEISFAETSFYDRGNLIFDYLQFPFGPFSGTYEIEGEIDTNYVWPDTLDGVGAFVKVNNDTTEINLFAPRVNPDTTLDVFAFHIRTEGGFVPGTYSVSPDMSTLFGFVWKADSLIIPDNPDSLNIIDLISSLHAEYIFISTSGSIVITEITDTTFSGTFSGSALDASANTLIFISNGTFSVSLAGINVNIDNDYMGIPEIAITNYPNPFSSSTTISFLATDLHGFSQIKIYNIKGQLVKKLKIINYKLKIGEAIWDGRDDEGKPLSNGIYFYQASIGETKSQFKKILLLK